jgi:serine/threonine-protein kinase
MGTEKLRRFLEFIVEQKLQFPNDPLKELVIGSRLYAPKSDFDPRLSAVVRVDATRLRAKLREYYASEGKADSFIIELPKGSYTPVFREIAAGDSPVEERGDKQGPSIAVLPFSNLSPEQVDYFSDGLTEEIIHALSSVEGIRVVARASCFALKHRNADVREIRRILNVNLVLEGSVRLSGDKLRVTAQLVDTANGFQVWSRRYDRSVNDIFAVQDEIACQIVDTVRGSTKPLPSLTVNKPVDFEAYTLYLRGRHHLGRQTRESLYTAIECFEHALKKDSAYASALTGIGVARLYLGLLAMDRPLESMPKAHDAARRALEIDQRQGEALSVRACTKGMYEWDWTGAEALFRQAIDIQPGSEFSKHLFTMFALLPMARLDESLAMLEEAMRIDPLSPLVSSSRIAVLLMARRFREAEAECRRALELDPDYWRAIVGLGRCYEAQGRYDAAILCYERATLVSDRVPTSIGALGRAYALVSRRAEAFRLLEELEELAEKRYVSPYGRVLIYLGLGDEKVFDWLERSYSDRAGWLMYLATDPRFDHLRTDQRFRSFLARLNLPIIEWPRTQVSVQ